ncbi:transposase [Luteolibacter pohnpeiensis]|nr:transposase [Luteolibacter pohnpeiensis]
MTPLDKLTSFSRFKIVVMQKYHALSEAQTKEQILDRFSFMRFLDMVPGDAIPDKSMIWHF